jgi:two-component sensor histidine kinase
MLSFLARLPLLSDRPAAAYALATGLVTAAWYLRFALDPLFPPGFPYLTFFPAVILSAFLLGWRAGTWAAILGGLAAWYFFIPPQGFGIGQGTLLALGFYAAVVAIDVAIIHSVQRANTDLQAERERSEASAAERAKLAQRADLLFHELQHRVANNIQMAGAVLALQRRTIADPDARRALSEASDKLQLIGRIQRQLYGSSGESLPVGEFLSQLVADLAQGAGKPGIEYQVRVDPAIDVPADARIPVALIMAESIANAIEHGFADREHGRVIVEARRVEDRTELIVTDDGRGLPADFDVSATQSLGTRIARTLAEQLGGSFVLESTGNGTRSRLTL